MSSKTAHTTQDSTPVSAGPATTPTTDQSSATEPTFLQKTIWELLDKIQAAKQPLPSIRAIRSMVGSGSMGTIADIVREWKLAHVPASTVSCGFDEITSKQIVEAIWKFAGPNLAKCIEEERRICEEKIRIAKAEADKLIQTAQEELAEAKAMQSSVRQKIEDTKRAAKESEAKLRDELSQLKGMVKALQTQNNQLIKANVRLEEGIAKANAAKAIAEANLATYRQLFPLLEKTLKKNKEV